MKKIITYFVTIIMLFALVDKADAFAESAGYEMNIPATIQIDDHTNYYKETVFKAVLTSEDGTEKELDVKANTTAYFKGFTYTRVGDYTYTVKQKVGDNPLIDYDSSEYTVLVRVLNDVGNGLTAKIIAVKSGETAKSDIVFHNNIKSVFPPNKKDETTTTVLTKASTVFLPFTGEQQISIAVGVGVLALGLFLIAWKKRRRDDKEE
ncbi:LPXTG cell wall anchor domain-containing protein [Carnobacteriaceae bacterium zg-ZUI78]|nr:LPXTG cell wall anchor domain-containing protein [Carnobacteriaceae bacterium zg-ZUI78]